MHSAVAKLILAGSTAIGLVHADPAPFDLAAEPATLSNQAEPSANNEQP